MGRKRKSKSVRNGLKEILALLDSEMAAGSSSEWVDTITEKEYREAEKAILWLTEQAYPEIIKEKS